MKKLVLFAFVLGVLFTPHDVKAGVCLFGESENKVHPGCETSPAEKCRTPKQNGLHDCGKRHNERSQKWQLQR